MGFIATVMITGFILASSSSTSTVVVEAREYMTTPLNYGVYDGSSNCEGDTIDEGTVKYLAPLDTFGSYCENSVTSVDANGDGIMVATEIYTKINVVSCDAYPTTGYVFVEVYLCYDSGCGDCEDDGGVAVSAQLILPDYEPYPDVDECWGMSSASTLRTTLTKFDAASDPDAVMAYWKIFADNSCIGESVTKTSTDAAAEPDSDSVLGAQPAAVGSGSASVTTNMKATATAAIMMVLIVLSL